MTQNIILSLIIGCSLATTSCSHSSNNIKTDAVSEIAEDDRPPLLENSNVDRTFSVVLEITPDSLVTCNNNFAGVDENPLILDTTNPSFPKLISDWISSMDADRINRLKTDSELHIIARTGVTDATIEKVKGSLINCGIKGWSISNF